MVATSLKVVGYQRSRAWIERARIRRGRAAGASAVAGARAVESVGRLLPWMGSCLPQALAGWLLLGREGVEADLRVAFFRKEGDALEGHAWLELDGEPLLGGRPPAPYSEVELVPDLVGPDLERERPDRFRRAC